MQRRRLLYRVCALFTVACACAAAPIAAAQQEQYREREVLDPSRDEWLPASAETAGEPADAISHARLLLLDGKAGKAEDLLKDWLKENGDHPRYYEALYLLAECAFEKRDYWKAYQRFDGVAEATSGELFEKALRREMDVARAFLAGERRIVWKILRLPAYDDAIEILDRIWERVPGSRLGEEALKLKADYFFHVGDMDLAQDEYANLVREYPNGRYTQLAMLRSAEAAEAAFPGVLFDDRALLEAEERYRQVQAAFPEFAQRENVPARLRGVRERRAEKDLRVGRWYERRGRVRAAEFYYRLVLRQWPETIAAREARTRLRALGVEVGTASGQPSAGDDS